MSGVTREIRRAFSLVELAVSMAVVTVLASLLLPGLAGAREAGRQAGCATTSRHLVLALGAYAGDFRGVAPPAAARALRNLDRWHGSRSRVADAFGAEGGALWGYLGEGASAGATAPRARQCPSFAGVLEVLAASGAGFERSCGGYGYNARFVGSVRVRGAQGEWRQVTDRTGSALHRFADPAGTLAFADAALASAAGAVGVIEYSFIEPRWWPENPTQRPDPSMHFRHAVAASGGGGAGVATVLFLDGHAGAARRGLTWSSGLYGELSTDARTGWPEHAERDDNSLFDYE